MTHERIGGRFYREEGHPTGFPAESPDHGHRGDNEVFGVSRPQGAAAPDRADRYERFRRPALRGPGEFLPFREPASLYGRHRECGQLDGLLQRARGGRGAALVLWGEPGVGKTALLDYTVDSAAGLRVLRATGVEAEAGLAFAALLQLCRPLLGLLDELPGPQRTALRTVFGLDTGPAPDRFLAGVAVLGLLAAAAAERPLVCVVDDAHLLDRASAQALAFAARRLAGPVLLVFAAREPGADLAGLPELEVDGTPGGGCPGLAGLGGALAAG